MARLKCPCGGVFVAAELEDFNLEPFVGLPVVLPRVGGLRCTVAETERLPIGCALTDRHCI